MISKKRSKSLKSRETEPFGSERKRIFLTKSPPIIIPKLGFVPSS